LNIAWRYKNMPKVDASSKSTSSAYCKNFDLTKKLAKEMIQKDNVHTFSEVFDGLGFLLLF